MNEMMNTRANQIIKPKKVKQNNEKKVKQQKQMNRIKTITNIT